MDEVMGPADGQQKMRLLAHFRINATPIPDPSDDLSECSEITCESAVDCQAHKNPELISGIRQCGYSDYHEMHEWADNPVIWCPGYSAEES
jgi:hypothetical protein